MFDFSKHHTLLTSLACAAFTPELRSILVFDAPYEGLQRIAEILGEMLTVAGEQKVRCYQLGNFETDDDVWGEISLPGSQNGRGTTFQRLFSAKRGAEETQVIVVPDLTALSLAGTRSLIVLCGADVVHLERNGQSEIWKPEQCWIAGCKSHELGRVSPHLLERFALRLSWKEIAQVPTEAEEERVLWLMENVLHVKRDKEGKRVPKNYLKQISRAMAYESIPNREVLRYVQEHQVNEQYSTRRALTLVRFALALARLEGAERLDTFYINEAAYRLGLEKQKSGERETTEQVEEGGAAQVNGKRNIEEKDVGSEKDTFDQVEVGGKLQGEMQEVQAPQTEQSAEFIDSGKLCDRAYPEDEAAIEREMGSLKLPYTPTTPTRNRQGTIVGVEESNNLNDLALISTILAALRMQKKRGGMEDGLILERSDLRSFRRGQVTENIFLLVLDYTSLRECPGWEETLLPYLYDAYTQRAGIVIVKIGAQESKSPLRAEVTRGRNILEPTVERALTEKRGRATPLAHGLSLAYEQIQRLLQHGRGRAQKVLMVVISDGRGNVPLLASVRGEIHGSVGNEGVEDALREARRLRRLKHIQAVVLNPQPRYYTDLPERLAEALGAGIQAIANASESLRERKVYIQPGDLRTSQGWRGE